MPEIDAALRAYRAASKAIQLFSGDDLQGALDREAKAIANISSSRSVTLCHTVEKLDVLEAVLQSAWADRRDLTLLKSIKRDLLALVDRIADPCRNNIAISLITSGMGMAAAAAVAGALFAPSSPLLFLLTHGTS
jgi:hypothetical protein